MTKVSSKDWMTAFPHKFIGGLGVCVFGMCLSVSAEESHVAGIIAEVRDSVAKLRSVDLDAVPMAFWDFDGTIIKGDSGLDYEEGGKVCYRGLIPETIRAGVCPAYKGEDGVRRWKAEWSRMKEHGSWLSQGFDVQMYHGVEARVLDEFCERNLRENRMFDWFFTSSLAIWKALGELGVENYVVSANVEALVHNVAPLLGVSRERIRGSRVVIEGGRLTTRVVQPIPFGEGKLDAVREIVLARPHGVALVGFGNSYRTDAAFLRYIVTQRLPGGARPLAIMINGGEEGPKYKGLFHLVSHRETVGEALAKDE